MTPTSVGLVLVEGLDADGATMDGSAFDVRHDAVTTSEQAADAVRRSEQLAADRGLRLHSIGVTWSEDADAEAALLMESLSESGFDNVVPIRIPEATEALARGMAAVIGYETTAVCVIEPDTVIALIVHTGDGAVQTAFNHAIDSDESLVSWLSTVYARADWQPEALVLVGSAGGLESIVPLLEDALGAPVFAPAEAQLALARGAALASARSNDGPLDLDGGFAAFATRPTGQATGGRHGRTSAGVAALLVAGVVTFVVSASVAVSMELSPRKDAVSASPAAADVPQAPAAARADPAVLSPPVAVPPAPAALPPVVEAPPLNVAPLPETGYVPEAPAIEQVPEYSEATPVEPALAPPAYVPPAAAAPTPAYVPPVQTKKPGILTRIRDKLRFGDDDGARVAPPPPTYVVTP